MRLTGIMCVIAAAGMLAGCALRDTRGDNAASRASEGLWGDRPFEIIDWNFPTSLNQPPIEAPQRMRLDRTAIGVTWATRNPLPLEDNLAPIDEQYAPAAKADDAARSAKASDAVRASAAGAAARDGERRNAR